MAVIALAGGLGAPGVTTTAMALLLTWPLDAGRRMILAECDPDGGAILPGALQGTVATTHGLRQLALAGRQNQLAEAFWRQLVDLTEAGTRDRLLLPGLYDPAHASSMGPVWEQLAAMFGGIEQHGHDVLVDLGRRGVFGPSAVLAQRADVVVLVARTTLRSVQSAQVRLEALREQLEGIGEVVVLLVEGGPYRPHDVAQHLGATVVATLPWRPQQAAVLSDGAESPRRFETGDLMRAARSASVMLHEMISARRARLGRPDAAEQGVATGAR